MARVHNWQIGRVMSYWYAEARPRRQFATVFDINKCIACQTCTIACKTLWTSGRGQEYMFWNNVETKPYGFYPLGYDTKILELLGPQRWDGSRYEGRTIFEGAPKNERVLGWLPDERDYAHPNVGEDEIAGVVDGGMHGGAVHTASWMFYLARICNHCTYPACLAACPRGSIYKRPEDGIVLVDQKRCRGYRECVRACPYKKVFYNEAAGTSQKCIGCFPATEQGEAPLCFQNCIGKIRLRGWINTPDAAEEDNSIDYLVHVKKLALPLFPQLGLEPNVYYIPPVNVPHKYLVQMFGPGAPAAVKAYRELRDDPKTTGLLALFGSSPLAVPRFKVAGETVQALDEKGKLLLEVPRTEPVTVRTGFDKKLGVARANIT